MPLTVKRLAGHLGTFQGELRSSQIRIDASDCSISDPIAGSHIEPQRTAVVPIKFHFAKRTFTFGNEEDGAPSRKVQKAPDCRIARPTAAFSVNSRTIPTNASNESSDDPSTSSISTVDGSIASRDTSPLTRLAKDKTNERASRNTDAVRKSRSAQGRILNVTPMERIYEAGASSTDRLLNLVPKLNQ